MALPLGKLVLIVGGGLVASVLAKEGRLGDVSSVVGSAFKIVLKPLRQDDSTTSRSKPVNDSLLQQVSSLRQELQLLASNRSVTIVTSNGSGSGKYGVIVVVVVVGYGYVWWKGWKISDMMFATRRGLNDACASVAKQLEHVYSSISVTKRHLSSRIDRVDCKVDECAENTGATKDEVSELRGEVKKIGEDFQTVHHVVRSLETKISRIEGKQSITSSGVAELVGFVQRIKNNKPADQIEGGASRPAIELPHVSPSRTLSFPAKSSVEPPSPSTSDGSQQNPQKSNGVGISGLSTQQGPNGPPVSEGTSNGSSNSGLFGTRFFGRNANILTRSRSVMPSFT